MKTAFTLVSALLLVSAAACAQAPAQNPSVQVPATVTTIGPNGQIKTTTVMITVAAPCPVSMQARQRGLTQLVRTRKNPPEPLPDATPKPSQHIHLVLAGFPQDKQVKSAVVTARGLSARDRIDNLNTMFGAEPSDLRRTLDVTFTAEADGTVSADLDLPAFTSVSALKLESITYADGSKWEPASRNMCTVTPDRVMLVAGK